MSTADNSVPRVVIPVRMQAQGPQLRSFRKEEYTNLQIILSLSYTLPRMHLRMSIYVIYLSIVRICNFKHLS